MFSEPAERQVEQEQVRKALAKREAEAKANRDAWTAALAKNLVVAEPAMAAGHRISCSKGRGRSAAVAP